MESNSSSFIDNLEPDYEENAVLDSTVMDLNADDFTEKSIKINDIESVDSVENDLSDTEDLKSVDEMLKKEKGIWHRLKSLFRK